MVGDDGMADLNQSKVELLFSTPILIHHWNDSEVLNEQLRTIILEREQASAGESKSNVGGWQSTDDLASWAGAAGGEVVQRVMATVNHATRQLMIDAKGRVEFGWKIAIWANVNRRGQYNRMHFHPGSTWSGTYYVDVGDSPSATNPLAGSLEIMSPNQASAMSFLSGLLPQTRIVQPQSGMMIVFPSYLPHTVHPYDGERPRISIAFNVHKDPYP